MSHVQASVNVNNFKSSFLMNNMWGGGLTYMKSSGRPLGKGASVAGGGGVGGMQLR